MKICEHDKREIQNLIRWKNFYLDYKRHPENYRKSLWGGYEKVVDKPLKE